jgi:hypothetical protein
MPNNQMAMYGTKVFELGILTGPGDLVNGQFFNHNSDEEHYPSIGVGNRVMLYIRMQLQNWGVLAAAPGFNYWGIQPNWRFDGHISLPNPTDFSQRFRMPSPNPPTYAYNPNGFLFFTYVFGSTYQTISTDPTNPSVRLLEPNWSIIKLPSQWVPDAAQPPAQQVVQFAVPITASADFAAWELVINSTNQPAFAAGDYVCMWMLTGANAQ